MQEKKDEGAVVLVLDLAEAFRACQSFSGVGVGDACQCFHEDSAGAMRVRRVQFEGCVAEPLQTITAILLGSKWSCLLSRIVPQGALSEVTQMCPLLKLRC